MSAPFLRQEAVVPRDLLELLGDNVLAAGQSLVEVLRSRHVQYSVVVGIGDTSWKLALATAHAAGQQRFPMSWSQGILEGGRQLRLEPPVERGQALLVSDGWLPDEQLTGAVYGIRELHGTIADMAVIADQAGSHAVARTLGVAVHQFQMSEAGLIVPSA